MDFRRESLAGLADQVREKAVSARELTGHALERIEALNPSINAFVVVDGERALAEAAVVDEKVARGEAVGRLAGVPVGIKDTEDVAGVVTTYGSHAFASDAPAASDSLLVQRLRLAGCVVVGKTNTPELATKATTDNPVFGVTKNPWNPAHTCGGSSGGSAAAVAAGMVPLATGSDGGGSIRIPSSACALTGHKPSLGWVPDGGPRPVDWHHLTTRGVLARTARDVALGLDCVTGPDPSDLRSLPMPNRPWSEAVTDPGVPTRVAWSPTLGYAEIDPEVLSICERAVQVMAGLGAAVETVDTVFDENPFPLWARLVGTYNARTVERFRGTPVWERFDPLPLAIIDMASSSSAVDLVKAEDACHLLNLRLVELFHHNRLLLTPTTAQPPPALDAAYANWITSTYPFNMTRSPAGTVCAGFTASGLPVGLQVVGPQHGDAVVLRALAAMEDALGLDTVAPVWSVGEVAF